MRRAGEGRESGGVSCLQLFFPVAWHRTDPSFLSQRIILVSSGVSSGNTRFERSQTQFLSPSAEVTSEGCDDQPSIHKLCYLADVREILQTTFAPLYLDFSYPSSLQLHRTYFALLKHSIVVQMGWRRNKNKSDAKKGVRGVTGTVSISHMISRSTLHQIRLSHHSTTSSSRTGW